MSRARHDRQATTQAGLDLALDAVRGRRRAGVRRANAHLIYVAATSQPACVAHLKHGQGDATRGQFSAAVSSCAPPWQFLIPQQRIDAMPVIPRSVAAADPRAAGRGR